MDHLTPNAWAKADLCPFLQTFSIYISINLPGNSPLSDGKLVQRHYTAKENEVKPVAGMRTASPACTHVRHYARIHSYPPRFSSVSVEL